MSLNRFQKQFIKLATNQRRRWVGPFTRRKKKFRKGWLQDSVKVEIISAITGESTTAKAFEVSSAKFKKWLQLRNMRAQFADMVIPKNSMWATLTADELKEHPVIVKVGTYKVPYVVDVLGDKITVHNKTTCTLYLKTVDNIDYLTLINDKKKLFGDMPKPVVKKVAKKKKSKRKKHSFKDLDDEFSL